MRKLPTCPECIIKECSYPAYLGGLCEEHHEEDEIYQILRVRALHLLHGTERLDVEVSHSELIKLFKDISEQFDGAKSKLMSDPMAENSETINADALLQSCITVTIEILKAEKKHRNGESINLELHRMMMERQR